MKRTTIFLLIFPLLLPLLAETRKQYKLNREEYIKILEEELAEAESRYEALTNQVTALDSVTNGIFDALESVSPDTVRLAGGGARKVEWALASYGQFRPTIDLMYPETASSMKERVEKLSAVAGASKAYRRVADLMNSSHTEQQLRQATDSLLTFAQRKELTKNQKKEVEKIAQLSEKEWEDHTFVSELLAEVADQWPSIPDKKTAQAALTGYIYPTLSAAYTGKKQLPAQYGYLNAILSELIESLRDFDGHSARLTDEEAFQQWLLDLSKKL